MPAEAAGEILFSLLELVLELLGCLTESGRQKHRDKKAARMAARKARRERHS